MRERAEPNQGLISTADILLIVETIHTDNGVQISNNQCIAYICIHTTLYNSFLKRFLMNAFGFFQGNVTAASPQNQQPTCTATELRRSQSGHSSDRTLLYNSILAHAIVPSDVNPRLVKPCCAMLCLAISCSSSSTAAPEISAESQLRTGSKAHHQFCHAAILQHFQCGRGQNARLGQWAWCGEEAESNLGEFEMWKLYTAGFPQKKGGQLFSPRHRWRDSKQQEKQLRKYQSYLRAAGMRFNFLSLSGQCYRTGQ